MMTSRKKCLTFDLKIDIIQIMSKEISTRISPEGLEIANAYLQLGSVQLVSLHLNIDEAEVSEFRKERKSVCRPSLFRHGI